MSLVEDRNLIDELLEDQQRLTAVERFSQFHENATEPVQARHYRSLIPLSLPGKGEQYSFEVDLDACSGCKACVAACHSLNGLDEGESWRDVGTLQTPGPDGGTVQTVTTACHHCADPACANGCPTLAYEKEEDTGVVRHLDDQCIGCEYCTMTCPYEVPKYNKRLGIVRKCDMCQSRLREGEAPACVQSCPNEAIRIRIVPKIEIEDRPAHQISLLPGVAPSSITKPSTTFINLRTPDGGEPVAADHNDLTPAHSHTPLAAMLVLTQAAAGLLLFDALARFTSLGSGAPGLWHALFGTGLVFAGLACATAHLGQPLKAWKSFLGWRKSWLSREILVFGAWSGAAAAYAATLFFDLSGFLQMASGGGAVATGLAGVFCSVMVYVYTRRPFWNLDQTGSRFFLTVLAVGGCFTFPAIAGLALTAKLALEFRAASLSISPFKKSARILAGPLRKTWGTRLVLGLTGIALTIVATVDPSVMPIAFAFILAGEFAARSLFFQAVEVPKMPGGVPAK
ncbi:MAG: dimethyl sulfoxide reductase anchor subunit [Verrucomicrobiales bacterium]|nr:dimethyl sulfoxide reductase anchor subunit [Verrucomicrobiales bacterium]